MSTPDDSPLGKAVAWPERYDPGLLFLIERAQARAELRVGSQSLPFVGYDLWTCHELGWLDARGKPVVAIARLRVPASSPRLFESKSLKLYLNGFAHERIAARATLQALIATDLSAAAGAAVAVELLEPTGTLPIREPEGACIDDIDIAIDRYGPPDPDALRTHAEVVEEALVSHLFRSNCPVTGQPDWASVQVRYRGPRIDRASLLRYLVSFRSHNGFHESCVERLFADLATRCRPEALSVLARFTRRGGIDINPWRATPGYPEPDPIRCARQ